MHHAPCGRPCPPAPAPHSLVLEPGALEDGVHGALGLRHALHLRLLPRPGAWAPAGGAAGSRRHKRVVRPDCQALLGHGSARRRGSGGARSSGHGSRLVLGIGCTVVAQCFALPAAPFAGGGWRLMQSCACREREGPKAPCWSTSSTAAATGTAGDTSRAAIRSARHCPLKASQGPCGAAGRPHHG